MNLRRSVVISVNISARALHMVECGCYVPHEAHQEEWGSQDGIGEEVQASDQFIIPSHGIEVDEESTEP